MKQIKELSVNEINTVVGGDGYSISIGFQTGAIIGAVVGYSGPLIITSLLIPDFSKINKDRKVNLKFISAIFGIIGTVVGAATGALLGAVMYRN